MKYFFITKVVIKIILGILLDNLDRIDDALKSFDKAIQLNPKYD